jgi:hypothetical protein
VTLQENQKKFEELRQELTIKHQRNLKEITRLDLLIEKQGISNLARLVENSGNLTTKISDVKESLTNLHQQNLHILKGKIESLEKKIVKGNPAISLHELKREIMEKIVNSTAHRSILQKMVSHITEKSYEKLKTQFNNTMKEIEIKTETEKDTIEKIRSFFTTDWNIFRDIASILTSTLVATTLYLISRKIGLIVLALKSIPKKRENTDTDTDSGPRMIRIDTGTVPKRRKIRFPKRAKTTALPRAARLDLSGFPYASSTPTGPYQMYNSPVRASQREPSEGATPGDFSNVSFTTFDPQTGEAVTTL